MVTTYIAHKLHEIHFLHISKQCKIIVFVKNMKVLPFGYIVLQCMYVFMCFYKLILAKDVKSEIPLFTLITCRTSKLAKHALAVQLVRSTGYHVTGLLDKILAALPTGAGKENITEINTLCKILSKLATTKQEAQLILPTMAWDQKHSVLTGVPTGSRVSLTDFSPDKLNSVCSGILSLEDVILQALPNVETLTLLEQSGTKLRSSEPNEQRKAIKDLLAGFVKAIFEKSELTLAELMKLLNRNGLSESNTKTLESICQIENNLKTGTELFFSEEQKQELMTSYKMCVEVLVEKLRCLTFAEQIKVTIIDIPILIWIKSEKQHY